MRKTLSVIAVVSCAVASAQMAPAPKAPKDEDLLVTSEQMDKILQSRVSKETGEPAPFSSRLFDAGNSSTAFIRLTKPDKPHAHGQWSEVLVIRDGEATLETSGTMIGPFTHDSAVHRELFTNGNQAPPSTLPPTTNKAPTGDRAGTAIEGGRIEKLKAGDIVFIPAGVNHMWLAIDKPIVYLDIKFPKAE